MIQSDDGLEQSIEQLERMYRVLLEFRRRLAPLNQSNYQVFAEGPIEEIRRLQRDIDEYLTLNDLCLVSQPSFGSSKMSKHRTGKKNGTHKTTKHQGRDDMVKVTCRKCGTEYMAYPSGSSCPKCGEPR
jgi:hypothetical protein